MMLGMAIPFRGVGGVSLFLVWSRFVEATNKTLWPAGTA
jgi:hypothetical protein